MFLLTLLLTVGCWGGINCGENPDASFLRLSGSFAPPLELRRGETSSAVVTVRKVNPIDYPVTGQQVFTVPDVPGVFDVEPNEFTLNMTSVDSASQTLTVTADPGAELGVKVTTVFWGSANITTAGNQLNVTITDGTPGITITADPQTISGPDGALAEQMIDFEVASVGGFSGEVVISYTTEVALSTVPADNNRTVTISPSQPARFTQSFRRAGYTAGPERMTWRATNTALGASAQVVITVNKE
ncbi:MAG: hypothetical protein IT363_10060 [Methanoregulaceae archaeon]|nr:hypothetical protein [Methanoregulaceae archaeon]